MACSATPYILHTATHDGFTLSRRFRPSTQPRGILLQLDVVYAGLAPTRKLVPERAGVAGQDRHLSGSSCSRSAAESGEEGLRAERRETSNREM